ncbi:IgGFc-binding protein-like [Phyllobates terribilis]|uniref:IgGFc-binding protein-like n=1 Tax=Phyllobates terribilis TaxID=111132 RepID=UPI003CCAEDB1
METAAAMGRSQGLPCLLLLCLAFTLGTSGVPGTEFITAFMQNKGSGDSSLSLSVTALQDSTTVSVIINSISRSTFNPKLTLNKLEETIIQLPARIQLADSGTSNYVVYVNSNNPVSVVSINSKGQSSDTASLLPLSELGTEYYVVTPPEGSSKEFAIITKDPATITIYPTGTLTYLGKIYTKEKSFVVKLQSSDVVQFQSEDDLSGTRVVSDNEVAVLSGHTCAQKFTKCNHVYEQLQPTFIWGLTFFISTLSFQTKYDLVYVTAATDTTLVTYQAGSQQNKIELDAGKVLELQLKADTPLFINATEGIQVMYYSTGSSKGSANYNTLLMTVPDVTSFCTSFQTLKDFSNEAILVAKTSDLKDITVNKASLEGVNWKTIQGTEYSWGEYQMTSKSKQNIFESSKSQFFLSVYGMPNLNSFGEVATCIAGSSRPSCSQVQCRTKEVCKIERGKAKCQAIKEDTCWAWGDPHYRTFDAKYYDFQGTCSYTMAKTCNFDLPFFNIETQNENRGSSKVSYLKSATIQVYNYTIVGIRSEFGVVRVNNQKVQLPMKLNDDKLILSQSGTTLIVETDFKLKVIYDWNILLKISIPSSFYKAVCGLCGNYNDNPNDDLSKEGATLSTINYGKLWKVEETSDGSCHDDCNGDCVTCTTEKKKLYGNNQFCGILTQNPGPFKVCHTTINPSMYRENCIYDMCLNDGYLQILCQTLKTYSDACAREGIQVNEWRNISNCPMDCPGNSTYNSCGSACPATCQDQNAPSKCTQPCIETCECNNGFVLIEGTCQPKEYCGCSYQGRLMNPGDSFWVDTACKKKCVCNPSTHKVECFSTKCAKGESCSIKDGIQDCYPLSYATCSASGDPHYVTFDGLHFDFQGACQYLLSGLCNNNKSLTDFQIIVRNENQGSLLVSYTTAVIFKIFGIEIQVRRENPAAVLVDKLKSNLPLAMRPKLGNIDIFQSGRQCIIQTNIGIRVTFDWEARVGVTLPSIYFGSVCGLCGNFNNVSSDELIDRDGKVQPDIPLFGHSWREGENADQCKIVSGGNCTNLLKLEGEQKKNPKECGMVLDPKGPFRNCHSKIDPVSYFKDCVYDMCAYGERQDLICRLLTGYAASCQDVGAVIYEWRSDICPMSCPLNSGYNICVSGCPSTCFSLSMSSKCDSTCREGCECAKGFVLSGTECVPMSQCGCLYNTLYYKPGDIFYPENTCENKCTCNGGGTVTCVPTSCGPYEECSIVNGIQSCNPVGSATCSAIGRTTFNTFDNFGYDFNGNCSYILSQTCLTEGSNLTPYIIRIRNIDGSFTISKKVILEVYNYTVTIFQGTENKILVNDILRNVPFVVEANQFRADYQGGGLVLKTDFGLVITSDNAIHVTVPGNYHKQTCGLCGNYNDDPKDEYSSSNSDAVSFAESWKEEEDFCTTNEVCSGDDQLCADCPRLARKEFASENFCGILTSPSGPFSPCHQTIDPAAYLKSCINALCSKNGELCTMLQGYAKVCQDAGVAIKPWRTQSFCPYTCSQENSHYELCAAVCSTSCSSLYDITSCPTTCAEGCQCDTGYFFQNGLCVTPDLCDRCILNSTFYRVNETIISEDCSQSFTCTSRHLMDCQPYGCSSDEICTVVEGKVQCINKDPCKSVVCRNQEHCETTEGHLATCVPDYSSSCTAWGDPHFMTFDGYNFDFHGTCTYILAEYVGSDITLDYFRVEEKNDNRGSPTSSSVRLINIFVHNYNISIVKDEPGQVRINGEIINLPIIRESFTITQVGEYAVLKMAGGIQVEYDYNWHVEITLPSSYFATIGGLCGNFNGNSRDDKVSRENVQMTVITKWAKSWKVDVDEQFCWDSCHGSCAECNETQKSLYEGEEFCGRLEADDGPFSECHANVSTTVFFDNCIKDVCSHDGLGLCQAFEAYIAACRKQGILIPDWRKITGCDMNCQENSHYEFCGNACPATCLDKSSPDRCTEACREICQCNEGYVSSAGQCIDVASCGCIYKDHYYKPNQVFWSDDKCNVRCNCEPILGLVVCTEDKCKDTERCMLKNGVRDCYPISFSTCISTGDPHYTTFDGRRYDFMGTCTYQLTGLCPSMDPNLTPFQVKVQNERRGSKTASYTKSLTLEVYNQTITLTRDHPQKVLVNGIAKFIPFTLDSNRIKAFMKGEHAFVRTDFELTINYNWDNYGRVMVPSTYAEALCGMCGNFNQDPSDDLAPNGKKEDYIKFEEKYRVEETNDCKVVCEGDCSSCNKEDADKYSDEKYCGIIKKLDGPFSQCFDAIDPTPYFADCVYDTCLYGGQYSAVCGAITRYVSDCQEKGVSINEWRKYTICEPTCPSNSHYELCGPGCHTTCSSLNSVSDCQKSCTEGCYCDSGFVRSGDACVSISECGCDYNDTYYQSGQTFYVNEQCNEQCQCTANGAVECHAVSCGPNEECKVVNGEIACHSKKTGKCLMAGNHHFITFDGLIYIIEGSCSYTLVEVCSENLELGNFSIVAESGSFGTDHVVGTRSLRVNVHGYEILMYREAQWMVVVNEEIHILPLVLEHDKVEIHQEGSSIVLQTDFELVIRYDTINSVHITVPSVYESSMCGMCGNFNDNYGDDLLLPSGQLSATLEQFGAAWSASGDEKDCSCKENCMGCDEMRAAIFRQDESCGLLLSEDGPFADCHGLINVTNYFSQCLLDMCATDGQKDILCQSLQAYASACQAAGAKIQSWRSSNFCRLECPSNSHYELCTHTCDVSCSGISASTSCTNQCSEGCECDDGYLFDGYRCVPMENCGCFYNGRYYNLGDSVVSSDCHQRCTCQNGGFVECSQFSCSDAEYCGIEEGKQGCFEKRGTCTVSAKGGLVSFDGLFGSIAPDNTFDLTAVCRLDAENWFRIVVITQSCKSPDDFDVSAIHVYFPEFSVALSPRGQAWLNGRTVSLPHTSGAVTVESTDEGLLIRRDEDLEFWMGKNGDLKLKVHQKFSGALCGACGNFNKKKSDDLQIQGGKMVDKFSEFIASWRARDFLKCDPSCKNKDSENPDVCF